MSGLLTDFYELTMAQGYFLSGRDAPAVFDMFFRRLPFGGGYAVFAGLDPLLEAVENIRFSDDDILYLRNECGFADDFLDFLSGFSFQGDIFALDEGTPVFPGEPMLRVHGNLLETQLLESLILNMINFQTLIATKSARIYNAARGGKVLEFGLRRAQGTDGALSAARASYIGGAAATSNTYAARVYGIPASGTMAHSWVLTFDSEEEAFAAYADIYPDSSVFLIDTYNTLGSGIDSAIEVGKRMKRQGKSFGVRLDSGDPLSLSRAVRKRLDDAGLEDARIALSNELDEFSISRLVEEGAPIDFWGVGTRLVTGSDDASLTGVYKLAALEKEGRYVPVMKMSDDPDKSTLPGIKQVFRGYDSSGLMAGDTIALHNEPPDETDKGKETLPLLGLKMKKGRRIEPEKEVGAIRSFCLDQLETIPPLLRSIQPRDAYPVYWSPGLHSLVKTATSGGGRR